MITENLGLQGGLDYSVQQPDNDHRANLQAGLDHENRYTQVLGMTVGPRLDLPMGDLFKLYVNGQGGMYKGLSGRLNSWAPGVAAGGGLDFRATPNISVGLFGRWHRAYMSPHPYTLVGQVADQQGPSDINWVTAGVGLQWSFKRPAAPPRPAPVAQAPAPISPPKREKLVLRGVHFDFNKSTIRPDAQPILDEAANILKRQQDIHVSVEGHTDAIGSDAYNLKLSDRRAAAVKTYLVDHGVAASRLASAGFGKRRPVASNDTEDGRAQNRRVELQIK
jgi:outer membrane protein OmpA-like peptidoglycan-associated protein